jgi:hypothetical protein
VVILSDPALDLRPPASPPACSETYRVEWLSAGLGQGGVVTAVRLIELDASKRLAPPRPILNLVEPKLLETAL